MCCAFLFPTPLKAFLTFSQSEIRISCAPQGPLGQSHKHLKVLGGTHHYILVAVLLNSFDPQTEKIWVPTKGTYSNQRVRTEADT